MALFLLMITIVTCLAGADSVTDIASCTSHINDQCKQNLTSCSQPPCSLSCGRASPQLSCLQDCSPTAKLTEGNLCDSLDCHASQSCYQTCSVVNCNSSTCTSKDCDQKCLLADCGRKICKANVTNCKQDAYHPKNSQVMECDAQVCNQMCTKCGKSFSSDLTCSSSVETCEQRGVDGKFNLKCSPGVKNCTQNAQFSIANMECGGDRCVQSCFEYGTCNMNCSSSVRECTQAVESSSVIDMTCDADVCTQDCAADSRCNMTCSSTVKECTQTCKGTCVTRCDAEVCKVYVHSTPPSTITTKSGVSKIGVTMATVYLTVMSSVGSTW